MRYIATTVLCLVGLLCLNNQQVVQAQPLCVDGACFQVGPRLVSVNSEQGFLLNALLSALGGGNIDLDVLDWNALAGGEVSLIEVLEALETNLSLANTGEALTTSITLFDFFTALADVAEADGDLVRAAILDDLALQVQGLTGNITLGDLLDVQFPDGSLADIDLDIISLITGGIQLFNFENVATTTPVVISGSNLGLGALIEEVSLQAQVVEPPVFGCGPEGTEFHTAAIRLKLDVDLVDIDIDETILGIGVEGTLGQVELYVEVARANATLTMIDAIGNSVQVQADPSIVDLYIGTIDDAVFFNRETDITEADFDPVAIADLTLTVLGEPVSATITVKSFANGSSGGELLTFNGPFPETQTTSTSTTALADLIDDLLTVPPSGNLMIDLDFTATGNPLIDDAISAAVDAILADLTTPVIDALTDALEPVLADLIDPVLDALGIGIGEADVTVFEPGAIEICDPPLPVEFVSFDAVPEGRSVVMTWETATETNNAGFAVEMTRGEGAFEEIGFVEGAGTTVRAQRYQFRMEDAPVGLHRFRLKQVDFDGSSTYSPEVEVDVELPDAFVLDQVYPNPFNPQATVRFAVRDAQAVRVELYTALGQRVRVLYAGQPVPGEMHTVQLDGTNLTSGVYLVRLVGEGFAGSQSVTLLK